MEDFRENEELLKADLLEMLEQKKYPEIRDILSSMNVVDIANLFDSLPKNKLPLLYRLLPKETAADTFAEMDQDAQQHLIIGFSDSQLKDVFDELYLDDAVDIIEEMPANVVKRIISNAQPDTRKMINEILKYPDDSAGTMMTIEYVSLRRDMTVEEALKRIRRTGVDKETIYTCYVTEENRKLLGIVTAKSLLLSEMDDIIDDIMETNMIYVHTLEDKEVVANLFSKYDLLSLPVVDDEKRLVGIITIDDALDVMQDEATEDMKKMAAITPSDKPYLRMKVADIWKARVPWLLILMISSTFTGMIITSFEDALAAQVVLTAFIPMLMNTGGNSGTQASVTIIRGLSLNEIEMKDIFKVILMEIRVALLCGITLAVANFIKMLLFDRVDVGIALAVSITLVATVFLAKIVGSILPIIAKRIGFDPAVMAGPFITTIVDALSLLIYFQFATIILGI